MIERLLFVTNDDASLSHEEQVELACRAGVPWIQLRAKGLPYLNLLLLARRVREITSKFGVKLFINDNVRVAREVCAEGVHLGEYDMPPVAARQLLGAGVLIGGTAHTAQDLERLYHQGVDYIGIGPFRFTETKKENLKPELGSDRLRELVQTARGFRRRVPVVAIGGIREGDIADLIALGLDGVAISSCIANAADPLTAARNCLGNAA